MWASDDSVLGSIERSNAHLDQILHRSGIIFLIRSYGKILLQSRSSSSATFPGRGILPALSMSRSENPTNRQQDVNSKKRRESQHTSRTSESSHTMSHPRTRSWRYSHVEVMTLSELIVRNRLKHRSTQETMLT